MPDSGAPIHIELVYAQAQHAVAKNLTLAAGATVADALRLAAQDAQFEAVDLKDATLGIYGLVVEPDQLLSDGDRIEIYRPLAEDPKAARRKRARASSGGRMPPGRAPAGS